MAHLEEGGQKSGKKVYSLQLQQRYQWTTVIKKKAHPLKYLEKQLAMNIFVKWMMTTILSAENKWQNK